MFRLLRRIQISNMKTSWNFGQAMLKREKVLENYFYETFYVDDFKIGLNEYEDKGHIRYIWCGSRGSLVLADMASLRIGLDPLVSKYYKLNGETLFS